MRGHPYYVYQKDASNFAPTDPQHPRESPHHSQPYKRAFPEYAMHQPMPMGHQPSYY